MIIGSVNWILGIQIPTVTNKKVAFKAKLKKVVYETN